MQPKKHLCNNILLYTFQTHILRFFSVIPPNMMNDVDILPPAYSLLPVPNKCHGRGFIGYPKGRNRDIKLVNRDWR